MREVGPWAWLAGMFVRPRRTMSAVAANGPLPWTLLLAACAGVSTVFQQAAAVQPVLPGSSSVIALALAGALIGIAGTYAFGWLAGLSGRWMGGRASTCGLGAAIAWGGVPGLLVGGVLLLRLGLFGWPGVPALASMTPALLPVLALLGLASIVFSCWSVFATVSAISEIQGFSSARAVGSALLAGVMFAALGLTSLWLVALWRD